MQQFREEDFPGSKFIILDNICWSSETYPNWLDDETDSVLSDVKEYQSNIGDQVPDESKFPIYKKAPDGMFYNIVNYKISNKNGKVSISSKLKANINAEALKRSNENKLNTVSKILHPFMHGFDEEYDDNVGMKVLGIDSSKRKGMTFNNVLSGEDFNLDETKSDTGVYHHIKVVNNQSVHKRVAGQDPSALLKFDYTSGHSHKSKALCDKLDELLSCVYIDPTEHKKLHNTPYMQNAGIESYIDENKPWALRSRANYDRFYKYLHDNFGFDKVHSFADRIIYLSV